MAKTLPPSSPFPISLKPPPQVFPRTNWQAVHGSDQRHYRLAPWVLFGNQHGVKPSLWLKRGPKMQASTVT